MRFTCFTSISQPTWRRRRRWPHQPARVRLSPAQHAALLADLQLRHLQIDALPVGEAFYQVCIELIVDVAHARFFAAPLLRGEASPQLLLRRTGGWLLENVVCP